MTFTWDPTALDISPLQQARLTIGDKDSTKPLLTDEEINFRLGEYDDSVLPAAIVCVRDILAKLARDIDRNNVGMSATRSQMTQHYRDLLKELKERNSALAESSVGGTSLAEETTAHSNTDTKQVGMSIGWGKNTSS